MGHLTDGWAWPGRSHKAHYFVGATSLCGRWMFIGADRDSGDTRSKDDCVKCRRLLDDLTAKDAPPSAE